MEIKKDFGYASMARPKQRVSAKEKLNPEWQDANVNYWISRCNTQYNYQDILTLYKAAAGKLNEKDYSYVTNPLATDNPKLKGYPSKIRNIDIISPNIQTLMGELIGRYFNPMVTPLNADIKNKKLDAEYQLRVSHFQQDFVNSLVQQGLAPEEIAQQQEPLDLKLKKKSNIKDEYAKIGQAALDYILDNNDVNIIRRRTLYDFIVSSKFITYRDVLNEDLEYEDVPPIEMSWLASPTIKFLEDAQAIKRQKLMSLGQLIDKFSHFKEFQDILPELELKASSSVAANIPFYYNGGDTESLLNNLTGFNNMGIDSENILVQHIQWTGMKKMFRVTGNDLMNQPYTIDVDEDYICNDAETAEEYWINEKMEGYKLADMYTIGVKPIEYQRGSYNNPSKCKNSYNGKIFLGNYVTPQSIVEKGLVYQIKYNTVHYYLELILAKNMDKVTLMPLGLIPDTDDMDMYSMIYYAKAFGFIFVDESNPQSLAALQQIKVLDMSLSNYIQQIYAILQGIKSDWDESVGITRQRKGQNMASDGKGVNQESIYRSAIITEEFFQEHEETIIKDLQCLVDLSKVAWRNGKKANFMSSDFKLVDLDIDPTVYQNIDLGITIKNSGAAKQELDSVKAQMGNFAQQTSQLNMIPRIARATNMSVLIEEMDEMVLHLEEQQKAAEDAKNQIEQTKIADNQSARDLEKYKIDEENEIKREEIENKLDIATMNNQTTLLSGKNYEEDRDNDGTPDVLELEKLSQARREHFDYLGLERDKLTEQRTARREGTVLANKKLALEKQKIAKMSAAKKK